MPNIVYALTNPAMSGFVKIGMTNETSVQARMSNLYSTRVPFPFECAIAWEIEDRDAGEIEKALHAAFGPYRVNPSREFFEIDPEQVQALLRVIPGRDVTPEITRRTESEDDEAAQEYQGRRNRTNELEFLESLNESGVRIYEQVLALGKQPGMLIRWGLKGFSLNVRSNAKTIGICWGFPPSAYNQAIYTGFGVIWQKCNVPEGVLETLREEAIATKLFVPAGVNEELKCQTDQGLEESQLMALIGWLTKVIATVRDLETASYQED